MKHLKFLLPFAVISVIYFTVFTGVNTASSESIQEGFLPTQGSYFKYHMSYERVLPNGDFLGIVGYVEIEYFQLINSTHIDGELEAVVDLSWIQGKQELAITQNIMTRSLTIDDYQGAIISGVLYYFGNENQFFNPIYISPQLLENNLDVYIWSYLATNYGTRLVQWNYKEIRVTDYHFTDHEYAGLGVNASYHSTTGILIVARCYFLENTMQGLIQHIMYVYLERTSVSIEGVRDMSPLLFFLGLVFLLMSFPAIMIIIWILKKPKKILEGGP